MEFDSKAYIDEYIQRGREAQQAFEKMSQEQVDQAVYTIAKVVFDHAEPLARYAVDETGMGNYEDKVAKNRQKARIIWNSLQGKNPGASSNGMKKPVLLKSPSLWESWLPSPPVPTLS
jgi:acyl-CoA reductase-like NAD-dependent aldehyde dehydrogenase